MFKDGRQLSPRLSLSRETEHLQRPVRAAMRPLLRGLRLHSLRGMRHRSTRLSLKKNEKMARLRTILPVSELVCNPLGDCIVSLERRIPDSSTSVRIYFKWRVIRELKTPMRVIIDNRVNERDWKQARPTNIVAMVTGKAFAVFSFFMDFNVYFNNPDSMTSIVRDQLPSIETKYAGKG